MSIQVSGLVHPYISVSSLFPIDISAQHGDALAICGANGSGKTTFLKLLFNIFSFDVCSTYTNLSFLFFLLSFSRKA